MSLRCCCQPKLCLVLKDGWTIIYFNIRQKDPYKVIRTDFGSLIFKNVFFSLCVCGGGGITQSVDKNRQRNREMAVCRKRAWIRDDKKKKASQKKNAHISPVFQDGWLAVVFRIHGAATLDKTFLAQLFKMFSSRSPFSVSSFHFLLIIPFVIILAIPTV